MATVKERLSNGWYHVEEYGKIYVYQCCPGDNRLKVGDVVEILVLDDEVCEVIG